MLFALLLGVALAAADRVEVLNHSQPLPPGLQPIAAALAEGRKGGLETPEVVLSVKYEGGAIDGIYLAQYRKGGAAEAIAAVPEGPELCTDLCHAVINEYCIRKGLGGKGCGGNCHELIPVGLLEITQNHNSSEEIHDDSSASYGVPRMAVCPVLCQNNLGYPLCGCAVAVSYAFPRWSDVCAVFCDNDGYTLRGCPSCKSVASSRAAMPARLLDTAEGWNLWCNVQCRQGHGGAACLCDMAPFSSRL